MLFLNILASERFLPFNMSYPGYASIFNYFMPVVTFFL